MTQDFPYSPEFIAMTEEEIRAHIHKASRLSTMAIEGAKLGFCGKMCNTCAFKKGSVTQGEPHNIEKAYQVLLLGGHFMCHGKMEYGNAGYHCAGFLYAKQYLKEKFNEE